MQSKASEMGLGQGEAALLTKMARLQGELSAKSREAEQSEMQLRAFGSRKCQSCGRRDGRDAASDGCNAGSNGNHVVQRWIRVDRNGGKHIHDPS